jgi:tRNA A37 N6-isopentenylltransferase MiaA
MSSRRGRGSVNTETLFDFRCVYFTSSDSLAVKKRIDLRCEEMVQRGLLEACTPSSLLLATPHLPTSICNYMIDRSSNIKHQIDRRPSKAIGYSEAISFLLYAPVRVSFRQRRAPQRSFAHQNTYSSRNWMTASPTF